MTNRLHYGQRPLYPTPQGLWIAKITKINNPFAWVTLENMNPDQERKALVVEGMHALDHLDPNRPPTSATRIEGADHTHGEHTHRYAQPLAPGDRVLVGFLEGRADQPVVLARLLS